jgi:hypothetical protein
MKKKLAVLVLSLSSLLVFLPNISTGAQAQIRVQIGRTHDRARHRGYYQGRRMYYYNYNVQQPQYVQQTYYVNGRRYTRWVRYY